PRPAARTAPPPRHRPRRPLPAPPRAATALPPAAARRLSVRPGAARRQINHLIRGFGPKREVQDPRSLPEHEPEVEPVGDLADLVADPVSDQRGLGVIQNDALLLVEPAVAPI